MMCLAAIFTALTSAALAAEPRPTLQEWKQLQDNATAAEETRAAKQAKMTAVDKVVTLLSDVLTQVVAEGEKEVASYNKFSCFCKGATAEKVAALAKGRDDQAGLTATINQLSNKRNKLDSSITTILNDINEADKSMKQMMVKRAATVAEYEKNVADLSNALGALQGAIKTLKTSKNLSLMQFKEVSNTIRTAALLADALGITGKSVQSAVSFFLQDEPAAASNSISLEDYKFHADSIVATLEQLLADFQKEKNDLNTEEAKSNSAHDSFMQDQHDVVERKTAEMEDVKALRAKTSKDITAMSQELTTLAATVHDDQEYLQTISRICFHKAKTWDQRSKMRQDEISTLTATIAILKSSVSGNISAATVRFNQQSLSLRRALTVAKDASVMEKIEAEAEASETEDAPVAFIQFRSVQRLLADTAPHNSADFADVRSYVANLLRTEGAQVKSTLLASLADKISYDAFAKVKKLLQELVERLLMEANEEAKHEGWCRNSLSEVQQKRDHATLKVKELNSEMANLEALISKLSLELDVLGKDVAELENLQAQTIEARKEEKAEYEATVYEAQGGLEAINQAIEILTNFYGAMTNQDVDLSLVQAPLDDMPKTTFKTGEAYKGALRESAGVVGMLEVIQSDFKRTIAQTQKAEDQAEQDHLEYMTELKTSLAEKKIAQEEYTKQKNDADEKLSSAEDNLISQTDILSASIEELIDLQPVCIASDMSYAERVAKREHEIAALKKALCILQLYGKSDPAKSALSCDNP